MRKFYFVFFIGAIVLSDCVMPKTNKNEIITDAVSSHPTNDTFHLLCKFWQLSDADHPTPGDVSFTNDSILYEPGIVFMNDSSVLENPAGEMRYGKFQVKGNMIHVNFSNGGRATYTIGRLHKDELWLKRTENKHTTDLRYKPTQTYWANTDKNPFSRMNYLWTIKPAKAESDEAIKDRVKECVQFYAYYLKGFVDGQATNINFNALPCCFNWYSGGISIQNEDKLDKKWINCFYSKDQAYKGRQMIEDVISKKYKWDAQETNWIKQSAPVLQQIHDSL